MADKFETKVNELARFGLRNPIKLTIGSDDIIQMNKDEKEGDEDQEEDEKKEIKQEDGSIVTPKELINYYAVWTYLVFFGYPLPLCLRIFLR